MSIEGMAAAWTDLASRARELHGGYAEQLSSGRPLEETAFEEAAAQTEAMQVASARIREEAAGPISEPGDESDLASELLLAAAAVDASLASDWAILDPLGAEEPPRGPMREGRRPDLEELPEPELRFAESRELLAQVEALFEEATGESGMPLISGGAPRPRSRPALIGDVGDSIDQLVMQAERPSATLLRGLWASASVVGHLISVDEVARLGEDLLPNLERIARPAPKMLREFILKLISLCPEGWLVDEGVSAADRGVNPRSLLERISRSREAAAYARSRITAAPHVPWEATDGLRTEIEKLEARYRKQMKCVGRAAWLLRVGALPLSGIAFAALNVPGLAVMPAVFSLSAGYVTYSLTDRLDVRKLGTADRVEGVVRLVDRFIDKP
jgi:hypothetical protein